MQEGSKLEFKEAFTSSFLKTVSAFANYGDGDIVFGVNDEGIATGIENPEGLCLRIENSINDSIEPLPRYRLATKEEDGVTTVQLRVFQGPDTPYCCSGKAYKRSHTATVKVDAAELRRLVLQGLNLSFEECPAADQSLEFSLLDAKLKKKLGLQEIDEKVYRTLELSTPDGGFNNAAAVLADTNRFPGIDIVRFGKTINDFMDRQTTQHVSALQLYDDALAMFRKHYQYEKIEGAVRKAAFLVPEVAYREAIANALVHRIWDVQGAIRVSCHDDRIEVISPGGLPDGVSEDDYLSGSLSILRNPIIASVFARLGYIERFGTGIPRIMAAYADCLVAPRFRISANAIAVILPVVTLADDLSDSEKAVLELLRRHGTLTRAQIEHHLNGNKSTTTRLLEKLGSKKLIEVEGSGRATRYKL